MPEVDWDNYWPEGQVILWKGGVTGLLLPALAVWRLTHLVWAEDGPWRIVARARQFLAAKGLGLVDCFYCLSLWVAVPFAVLTAPSIVAGIVDWLAFSGAAILLERATAAAAVPPPALWHEVSEDQTNQQEVP